VVQLQQKKKRKTRSHIFTKVFYGFAVKCKSIKHNILLKQKEKQKIQKRKEIFRYNLICHLPGD